MPRMTGIVETPETPQTPNNYVFQQIEKCKTLVDLQKLQEHARKQGYSDEGQVMTAIKAKLASMGGKK